MGCMHNPRVHERGGFQELSQNKGRVGQGERQDKIEASVSLTKHAKCTTVHSVQWTRERVEGRNETENELASFSSFVLGL